VVLDTDKEEEELTAVVLFTTICLWFDVCGLESKKLKLDLGCLAQVSIISELLACMSSTTALAKISMIPTITVGTTKMINDKTATARMI